MQQLRPLTIGQMLDGAIRIYQGRAKTLITAVAVPMIPMVILQTLITWSTQPADYNPFDFSDTQEVPDGGQVMVQLGGSLLGSLLVVLATTLATAACFRAISDAYVGERVDWRESLRFALGRFWSILGLTIVVALATLLGLPLCIVGVVIPMTYFSVATPVLLLEGAGVGAAMRRSAGLVKGRFWPVLGAVALSSILAMLLQGVVSSPAFAVYFVDLPTVASALVEAIFTGIALILVMPFTAAFTMVLYVDLRVRKEGFDLHLWAQRLGVEADPAPRQQPGAPAFPPLQSPPQSNLPPPPGASPSSFPPPPPPPPPESHGSG